MKRYMLLGVVLFGSMALQLVAGHKHEEISAHWFSLAVRYEQQEHKKAHEKTKQEILSYCCEIIKLIQSFDYFQNDKVQQAELLRITQLHNNVQSDQFAAFANDELRYVHRYLKEERERLEVVKWQQKEVFPWEEEKKNGDSPVTTRHAIFELDELFADDLACK